VQSKRRVLIITYYWPPQGGSGVQRWLKFAKYLGQFGWEPVIYTPLNPEMFTIDNSLEGELPKELKVIKRTIVEPYTLYKFFTGKGKASLKPGYIKSSSCEKSSLSTKESSWRERFSLFLRSNLFIPDPKILWMAPSWRFLLKYVSYNRIDAIVSTGPPHSMHLIAKKLSQKSSIPWIADFRDPWSKMFNFKYMGHLPLTVKKIEKLERGVLNSATAVVTVTRTIAEELSNLAGGRRVEVITNGFDPADFSSPPPQLDSKFTITYTGLFMEGQNPLALWSYLGEKVKEESRFKEDLKILLVGNIDCHIVESIKSCGLEGNLEERGYLPHSKIVQLQRASQLLLLSAGVEPEAVGILTGKYFEYVASGRPILAFAPLGSELHRAIGEDGSGATFLYNQKEEMGVWLQERYREFKGGGKSLVPNLNRDSIAKYSRRELTKEMAALLESILEK